MANEMRMISIDDDGVIRIACEGGLDGLIVSLEAHNPILALLGSEWASKRVLLDMSKTDYLGSTALGWLISCHRAFKAAGGMLVIHSASLRVRRVFNLINISTVVSVANDLESAERLVAGAQYRANPVDPVTTK